MTDPLLLLTLPTPAGPGHAVIDPDDGALRLFGWHDPADNLPRLGPDLLARGVEPIGSHDGGANPGVAAVREAVERYGDGDLGALDSLAVAQAGGEFFQQVWLQMRRVAPGRPITYTELAGAAGRPAAVRAAASACARNLVALVVPCHRIVRRDGGLGGYAYGLDAKRALHAHEERFAG